MNSKKRKTYEFPFDINGQKGKLIIGENSFASIVSDKEGPKLKVKSTSNGVKVFDLSPTTNDNSVSSEL